MTNLRLWCARVTGTVLGLAAVLLVPGILDLGSNLYDVMRPVVTRWEVTVAAKKGDDVVLSGTMIKHRDCLFVPPTLARDSFGKSYLVVSTSPTAGQTLAASDEPQVWGPWTIKGGAGKQLQFINVYLCGAHNPVIARLGVYKPSRSPQ